MGVRATKGKWGSLQLRAKKAQKSCLGQQGEPFRQEKE